MTSSAHYTAKTDVEEYQRYMREYRRKRWIENIIASTVTIIVMFGFWYGVLWLTGIVR